MANDDAKPAKREKRNYLKMQGSRARKSVVSGTTALRQRLRKRFK
jgi:hypothetical protein